MKRWGWPAVVIVVAVAAAFLLRDRDPGERTPVEREGVAPAPPLRIDLVDEADPDPAVSVLQLESGDLQQSPMAGRGPGFQAKRTPQAMETDYRNERELRVHFARKIVQRIAPRLELTDAQAQGLFTALMKYGDTNRTAFYREHGGGISTEELQRIQKEAAERFNADLAGLLDARRVEEFWVIEAEPEKEAGDDLGFGVVFGRGEGGGRARTPIEK